MLTSRKNTYTPEQKSRIRKEVMKELEKSFELTEKGVNTPMWQNILFMLQNYNQGNFYGTIEVKILGVSCNDARVKERTYKLQETYRNLTESP